MTLETPSGSTLQDISGHVISESRIAVHLSGRGDEPRAKAALNVLGERARTGIETVTQRRLVTEARPMRQKMSQRDFPGIVFAESAARSELRDVANDGLIEIHEPLFYRSEHGRRGIGLRYRLQGKPRLRRDRMPTRAIGKTEPLCPHKTIPVDQAHGEARDVELLHRLWNQLLQARN